MKTTLTNHIRLLDTDSLIALHNEYCDSTNNCDDRIYSMSELDELFNGMTPSQIIGCIADKFNQRDDYFYMDGYGFYHSTSDIDELPIYISDIVNHIIDSEDSLNDSEIAAIIA